MNIILIYFSIRVVCFKHVKTLRITDNLIDLYFNSLKYNIILILNLNNCFAPKCILKC